jgi:hypothetical protein
MCCIASWLAQPLNTAVCLHCPLTQPPFLTAPTLQLVSSPVPGAASCKLWQYGHYKQAHFTAHSHCFDGISQWKAAENCGGGLKCLDAAAPQVAATNRAIGMKAQPPPASLNLHHRCELLGCLFAKLPSRFGCLSSCCFCMDVWPPAFWSSTTASLLPAPAAPPLHRFPLHYPLPPSLQACG